MIIRIRMIIMTSITIMSTNKTGSRLRQSGRVNLPAAFGTLNVRIMMVVLFAALGVTPASAKINVVVSIVPQQTFVEKIGGEKVNVTTIVKPGSDPHIYEPKASQMAALSKAHLYFPIKIEFENAWLEKFKAQNKTMRFIEMTQGVMFMKMPPHGHGSVAKQPPFEWTGEFILKKGVYTWSFAKVDGAYADPTMRLFILKARNSGEEMPASHDDEAMAFFAYPNPAEAVNGDLLDADRQRFELHFDPERERSVFRVSIKEDGTYRIFTEHMPFEFENTEHFFKDEAGNAVEPTRTTAQSHGHHHHHHGVDPHTWVSPKNVRIMAKNIYEALGGIDPINRRYYEKNYGRFLDEIDRTDKTIRTILAPLPKGSKFMVFHPSWGYFAKEYGLVQLAVEVEGKAPKPKVLQTVMEIAKKEKIKAIFTQPEFSDKSARAIAGELNISVIKETPLAADWSENLIKTAEAIANTTGKE